MDTMNSDNQKAQYMLKKTVLSKLLEIKETVIIKTRHETYTLYNDLSLMDGYGDFIINAGDDYLFDDYYRAFVIITERGDSIEQKTTFYMDDIIEIHADD